MKFGTKDQLLLFYESGKKEVQINFVLCKYCNEGLISDIFVTQIEEHCNCTQACEMFLKLMKKFSFT